MCSLLRHKFVMQTKGKCGCMEVKSSVCSICEAVAKFDYCLRGANFRVCNSNDSFHAFWRMNELAGISAVLLNWKYFDPGEIMKWSKCVQMLLHLWYRNLGWMNTWRALCKMLCESLEEMVDIWGEWEWTMGGCSYDSLLASPVCLNTLVKCHVLNSVGWVSISHRSSSFSRAALTESLQTVF